MYKWKFTVHVPKETGEIPSPQSLVTVLGSPGFETALALRGLICTFKAFGRGNFKSIGNYMYKAF